MSIKSKGLQEVLILENKEISERYRLLRLFRFADFKAGQILAIQTHGVNQTRLYSIASGVNDDSIDILYALQPNGLLTPQIWSLQAGDTVLCDLPSGRFAPTNEPMTWIANGTGVAPFVAMLRSGFAANVELLHGARMMDELYYGRQFREVLGAMYRPCCSAQDGEDVFRGRVTDYLRQQYIVETNRRYMLCGSAEMVVEVRDLLLAKGVLFQKISAEIYF